MSEGWICLHRGWRDNPIFKGEYSRADAWVWLIENACWKATRTRIKGDGFELQRGELTFSVRFMADAWGWSKSRVDRFIADLREESMIETRSKIGTTAGHNAGQGQSIITICNYAKYQDVGEAKRDNDGSVSGTRAGQQRDKEEQGNKGTIEPIEEDSPIIPTDVEIAEAAAAEARAAAKAAAKASKLVIPDWVPAEAWVGFIEMRKLAGKAPTDRAVQNIIAKLDRFRADGHDPGSVLDQSTNSNWLDIYPIKDNRNGKPTTTDRRDNRSSIAKACDDIIFRAGAGDEPNPADRPGAGNDGRLRLVAPASPVTL